MFLALKLLDGGKGGKGDAKYREVVWKLDDRGESLDGLSKHGFKVLWERISSAVA